MTVNNDIDDDSATKHGDSHKERGKMFRAASVGGSHGDRPTSSRSASSPL